MAGINLRRRCYSNDTLPESRILMIGTVSGSTNVYVNEDSGYSLANSKSYAQGTPIVSQGNRSYGGVVSPRGKYFFQVERYGTSLSEDRCLFFKIEDEEVTLLNTITGDDLPADIVRPTTSYSAASFGKKGECVFTKDERYLYIASYNYYNSTTIYTYISKFGITDNGLSHVKTQRLYVGIGSMDYGPYLALHPDETIIASSVIWTDGSGVSRHSIDIYEIGEDGTLTRRNGQVWQNSYKQDLSVSTKNGRIHFSENGEWLFREIMLYSSSYTTGVIIYRYAPASYGLSQYTSRYVTNTYENRTGCRVHGNYVDIIGEYGSTGNLYCDRVRYSDSDAAEVLGPILFPGSNTWAKNILNYGGDTSNDGKYIVFNSMTSSYYYLLEMNFDDSTCTLIDSYDAGISSGYKSLAKFINEEE